MTFRKSQTGQKYETMQTQDVSSFCCGKSSRKTECVRLFLPLSLIVQAVLYDQAPPVIPRKHSAAEMTTCKALPNTSMEMEESQKKGEALFVDCLTGLSHTGNT